MLVALQDEYWGPGHFHVHQNILVVVQLHCYTVKFLISKLLHRNLCLLQ